MILILCALLARAGPPPDGVDLSDLDGYTQRSRATLQGPPGCWDVRGYQVWAASREKGGQADAEGAFQARLVDGVWQRLPTVGGFRPLVGRSHGGSRPIETLAEWLATLTGPVETEYLWWDAERDAVVLSREVELRDGGRTAQATTLFRDEGPTLDVTFPKQRIQPGVVLMGAGYTVRTTNQGGVVLPAVEELVFRFREQGVVVRGHQTLRYDAWRRCGAPP